MKPLNEMSDAELRREWCERCGFYWRDLNASVAWRRLENHTAPYPGYTSVVEAQIDDTSPERGFYKMPDPLTDANASLWGFQQATARATTESDTPAVCLLDCDGAPAFAEDNLRWVFAGDVCRRLTMATVAALRAMEDNQ